MCCYIKIDHAVVSTELANRTLAHELFFREILMVIANL